MKKSDALKIKIKALQDVNLSLEDKIEYNENKIKTFKKQLKSLKDGTYQPNLIERFLYDAEEVIVKEEKPATAKKKKTSTKKKKSNKND